MKKYCEKVRTYSVIIVVIQLVCAPCSIKNYPENFPAEITEKTSNLEAIISKYRTAVEDSLKKKAVIL